MNLLEIKQLLTEEQIEDIRKTYVFLNHKYQSEIRLIDPHKKSIPESKFVSSFEELIKICETSNEKYNLYIGINEREKYGTTRDEVISVKTIVIDIDPKRETNTNSTDKEMEYSKDVAYRLQKDLKEKNIDSFKAMSGNGTQLWISIPNTIIDNTNRRDIENKIKNFNKYLNKQLETNKVKIDNIGDLPRIIKIIGTRSIKGTDTKERPQRISHWIDNPIRAENKKMIDVLDKTPVEENIEINDKKEKIKIDPKIQVIFSYDSGIQQLLEDKSKKKIGKGEFESYSEKEMSIVCRLVKYDLSLNQIDLLMNIYQSEKWKDAHEQYKQLTYDKAKELMKNKQNNVLSEYLSLDIQKVLIYPSKSESMIKIILKNGIIELGKEEILTPKEFRSSYFIISGGRMLRDLKRDVWAKLVTHWTQLVGQIIMIEKGTEDQLVKEKIIQEIENFTLVGNINKCVRYGKAYLEDDLVIIPSSSIESIIKKNKWKYSMTKIAYWVSEYLFKPSSVKRIKGKVTRCWFFKKDKLEFDYSIIEEDENDNEEDD